MVSPEELQRLRDRHAQLLQAYVGKLAAAMSKLDPADASFAEVTNGLRLLSAAIEALAPPTPQVGDSSASPTGDVGNPLDQIQLFTGTDG